MIVYFSGTGNSRYLANRIANETKDELIAINERIKEKNPEAIYVQKNLIVVCPTYAWRIPRIVYTWILNTEFIGVENVWFVMSCGSEIGNADRYNRKLCRKKGFSYKGTCQIVMPENYIALFDTPKNQEARTIVFNAQSDITDSIQRIREKKAFGQPRNNLYDRFMSGVVNVLFYPLIVKSKAFYVKENCIGCTKCVDVCPLNNIRIVNQKPVWQNHCTHCMACINYCPCQAIEYGRKSIGKVRYIFDQLKIK